MVRLSLIITTYNRAEQLKTALLSVCAQVAEASDWECLVVNNNSVDNTDLVVEQIIDENKHLNIRLLHEYKQGLSHARNCGVADACGEIIIFVDDDESFVDTFISSYIEFFDRHPEVSVAGGGYEPRYEGGKPSWISPIVELPIAYPLDLGAEDRQFPRGKIPGGGNMALRRRVITQPLFNTELGRCGEQLFGGEEVELLNRLRAAGEPIWWVAGAKMYHMIPRTRLEMSYLTKLWLSIGVSQRRRAMIDGRISTLYLREAAKWLVTIALALLYMLSFRASKGRYLMLMRLYISRGLRGMR
ncbi:MAG: glycosyltransferase [Rikenellaceae bacterium]